MANSLKEHPKVLALLLVACVVLGAGTLYTFWPSEPPAMPETMDDVQTLLTSKNYKNLSTEQRRPYVMRVAELMAQSDREERRALMQDGGDKTRDAMRDMFKQMMVDRARQFALADAATREQMIQEDRARFASFGGPGRPGGGPRGEAGQGDRPEPTEEERAERQEQRETRVEQWVNEGNGQDWALIREYMQQVRPPRTDR